MCTWEPSAWSQKSSTFVHKSYEVYVRYPSWGWLSKWLRYPMARIARIPTHLQAAIWVQSLVALHLKCVAKGPERAITRFSEASTLLEQIGSSGKQFLQQHPNSESRFASWAAVLGTNWICSDCSITHPSIAAPIQLQLLATLPCTFFLERQFFGFVSYSVPRVWGKLRDAQRQRHAARASRSKTSSISPKSTSLNQFYPSTGTTIQALCTQSHATVWLSVLL
jgi:hypothetical protein